jgi:cysteine desulfurase
LDNNGTTQVLPEVIEAMMPYFTTDWGNPSSSYKFGSKLKTVIETAREQVADLMGAHPMEVIFTSCGTESNNAAIHAALKAQPEKRHIVTSAVEHSSVLNYCMALEKEGYRVTYLPVDRDGLLKIADLENAITNETALVSLMWANNETGVLFPVKEIAETCRSRGVLYHCDAVQAAGKRQLLPKRFPLIIFRSPVTSFTRRRASVRSTSGARRQSPHTCMVATRNGTSAEARRACR